MNELLLLLLLLLLQISATIDQSIISCLIEQPIYESINMSSIQWNIHILLASFCTSKLASVLGVTDLQVGIHTTETDEYYILFFSMITNNQKQKYVSWQMEFSLNLSWLSCIIVEYFVGYF